VKPGVRRRGRCGAQFASHLWTDRYSSPVDGGPRSVSDPFSVSHLSPLDRAAHRGVLRDSPSPKATDSGRTLGVSRWALPCGRPRSALLAVPGRFHLFKTPRPSSSSVASWAVDTIEFGSWHWRCRSRPRLMTTGGHRSAASCLPRACRGEQRRRAVPGRLPSP
jgi:hypothetical protein